MQNRGKRGPKPSSPCPAESFLGQAGLGVGVSPPQAGLPPRGWSKSAPQSCFACSPETALTASSLTNAKARTLRTAGSPQRGDSCPQPRHLSGTRRPCVCTQLSWQCRSGSHLPRVHLAHSSLTACHRVPFNSVYVSPLGPRQDPISSLSLAEGWASTMSRAAWGLRWGRGTAPETWIPLHLRYHVLGRVLVSETLPCAGRWAKQDQQLGQGGGAGCGDGADPRLRSGRAHAFKEGRLCRPLGRGWPAGDTWSGSSWLQLPGGPSLLRPLPAISSWDLCGDIKSPEDFPVPSRTLLPKIH